MLRDACPTWLDPVARIAAPIFAAASLLAGCSSAVGAAARRAAGWRRHRGAPPPDHACGGCRAGVRDRRPREARGLRPRLHGVPSLWRRDLVREPVHVSQGRHQRERHHYPPHRHHPDDLRGRLSRCARFGRWPFAFEAALHVNGVKDLNPNGGYFGTFSNWNANAAGSGTLRGTATGCHAGTYYWTGTPAPPSRSTCR